VPFVDVCRFCHPPIVARSNLSCQCPRAVGLAVDDRVLAGQILDSETHIYLLQSEGRLPGEADDLIYTCAYPTDLGG